MEKLRFRHGELWPFTLQYIAVSQNELAVPQKAYLKWVKNQIDLESACLELPFTILLLLSFSAFAIFSLKQDSAVMDITHNANFAFSEYMGHKNFEDVHSYADFWSWLRLGFLPAVFQPAWTYSERRPQDVASVFDLNAEPNATWQLNALGSASDESGSKPVPTAAEYLHFNRVVGSLPTIPVSTSGWYGKSCMPNVQEIAYPPELADAEVFNDPTKLEWMLPALDSFERIVEQACAVADGCSQLAAKNRSVCYCQSCDQWPWIREDVQRLEVSMITYNAHYGLLTYTGVHFWFLRGGRFHKRLELTSVFVNSAQPVAENTLASAFSLIWAVLLLWVFIAEVREIGQIVRNADTSWYRAILEEYIGFSNAVDWISFIIATVVAAIFVALAIQTAQLQATLRDLLLGAGNGREARAASVKNFFAEYEATYSQESTYRLMLSAYPLMLILRLLKSFDAQPRLAVITETLREASQDMLHFSLALSAMVVCLCLDAVLLFGRDIEDLGNFWRAFHFAFRIIFSEDEEAFQKLEKVSRFTAYAWFTIFTVLLVIILLNMLLAIIMDNYMIVKKRAQSLESLPYQMSQMWRRWRMSRRKERVKLDEIWATFVEDAAYNRKAMCQSGRLISPSFLMDMVPGIPSSQAERTLVNSWMEHLKELEPPFQVNDAHQLLSGMEAMTRKIRNGLFFAFDVVHYFDSRPAFMMSQASRS
ncbi:Short transient receptor potential channel 2 homolog (TrpC2) (Transient receptor protein 2) (TRP-2) (bTrp2) [Durusdinium trenchii]|uniref:Short transient receptor potential channel 2 homolog (TrpC2) (Transient receptor protein 2) (TRP-2) (BTrp2) n=1 Tax=Durusdinium trenchii TaxID=1381693 RepID=A0ABP0IYT5_9DINO